MNVTVFGGASPKAGEPAYLEAYKLGQKLARQGHTVLTGGYIGTMEAASRGANEAGGHVIGVTCAEIERWRGAAANPWVKEERKFATLHERLLALIDGCDAAVALPGGAGTLAEISMMWNRLIVGAIPPRPLILVGDGWHNMVAGIFNDLGDYIPEKERLWLYFAPDAAHAAALLEDFRPIKGL